MEDRTLLAVDITSADFVTGQFTFTGDRGLTTADNLVLSVQGGLLAHNLTVVGGTGNYSSATDFDPGPQTQTIAAGGGTAPLLRVNLLTDSDSLRVDHSGGILLGVEPIQLDAGPGNDTLLGPNGINTWNITGLNTGNLNNASQLTFFTVENLTGGTSSDTFTFTSNVSSLGGKLDGTTGIDTVSYSGLIAPLAVTLTGSVANGFSGLDGGISAGIQNIDTVLGGLGSDTLIGENVASNWTLNGVQTYNDGSASTLTFSTFETLQGGTAGDSFLLRANTTANLRGGTGPDSFTFAANGLVLTGSLDGEAGSDTLRFSGYTSSVTVALTGSGANGYSGSPATGISAGFSNFDVLEGGSGTDTLTGENVSSTWTLAATQAYSDGGPSTLIFSAFETLQGGMAPDAFNFTANTSAVVRGGGDGDGFTLAADGVQLTGSIDGEAGNDTLSYSGYVGPVAVTLTGSTANGYSGTPVTGLSAGFSNIDVLLGGAGADTLSGENTASTWSLGVTQTYNDGSAASLAFAGFESLQGSSATDIYTIAVNMTANLRGGGGADSFVFTANGILLTGTIDGEAGSDTLSYSGYANPVAVTLTSSGANGYSGNPASGVTGGFSNIDVLVGGSGADTLTGESVDSIWTLSAAQTYNDGGPSTLTFSAFETLQGGAALDSFNLAANTSATLRGGAGADRFTFTADGVVLTGSLDGEAGSDTLSYNGYTSSVAVTLTSSTANGYAAALATGVTGGVNNIDSLVGGAGTDTLTGETVASTWTLATTQTYNDGSAATLTFSAFETLQGGAVGDSFLLSVDTTGNLRGGAGADSFTFTANGVLLTGSIDGEAGTDTLSYSGYSSPVAVSLTGSGASGYSGNPATGVSAGFSNIDALGGGTGVDTLTGANVTSTWNLAATQTYNDGGAASLTFIAFETLQGGTAGDGFLLPVNTTANLRGGPGADRFILATNGVLLTGSLDGEAGSDTLSYSGYTSPVAVTLAGSGANGYSGNPATGITGGFSAIDVLQGGSGLDTLTGENVASLWNLAATQTYSDGGPSTLTFAGFETLQGGSVGDSFNLVANTSANLRGGPGADNFTFTANGILLIGSITGEAGSDTLSYSGYSSSAAVTLISSTATGYNGNPATGISAGFADIDVLVGGSGADTLTGENVTSTWTLAATQTYNDGTATILAFSAFETLQGGTAGDGFLLSASTTANLRGGAGADSFTFTANGVGLTGSIDGEAGSDTLSYNGYTSPVAVTLTGSGAHGYSGSPATGVSAGFSNLDLLVGGSGADTLTGENVDSTWILAAIQTYNDGGPSTLTFSAFETLQGGSGSDAFTVNAPLVAAVTINGGAGTTDSLTVNGTANEDNLAITGTTVTVNGVAITYQNLRAPTGVPLVVNGQSGNDTFTVTLPLVVGVAVNGDAGIETLTVNGTTAGDAFVLTDTQLTRGTNTLTYATIEGLSVDGREGDDTLRVDVGATGLPALTGTAPGSHSNAAFEASTTIGPRNIGIHFRGSVGDDALTIDLLTTSAARNIAFFADSFSPVEPKSGVVNVGGAGAFTMSFDGLAPVALHGVGGNLLVDATATPATSSLTLADDATANNGISVITGDGGFETTTFSGFSSLTVRGGDGSETITLASLDPADPDGAGPRLALTAVTLTGDNTTGTDLGADTLAVQTLPATITATLFGGAGNDVFNLGSATNTLAGLLGPIFVNGDASDATPATPLQCGNATNTLAVGDTLNVNDQGTGADSTYTLAASTFQRTGTSLVSYLTVETVNLNAGTGSDTITVTSTAPSVNTTVAANGGTDVVTLDSTGALSNVVLNGQDGTDILNVRATTTGSVTVVNGGAGNDTINLGSDPVTLAASSLSGIQSVVCVNGDATDAVPPGDTLNLNDQGNSAGSTYTLTATTFERTGTALITYATVETLALNAGSGADTINVLSTLAATASTVNAGAGNDTINVGSNPVTPANSNLESILGSLTINGQTNDATPTAALGVTCGTTTVANTLPVGDTLNLIDQGNLSAGTYALAATTFQRSAPTPATALVIYATVETINLNAGTAGDMITVASTAASATTTVNASQGNDVLMLASTGSSSNVVLNGQEDLDTITVQGSGTGSVIEVNGAQGTDTIRLLASSAGSGVRLSGGDASDTLNILGAGATSVTEVNGGAANDVINLGSDPVTVSASTLNNVLGQVCINGDTNDATPTTTASVTAAGATVTNTLPAGDTLNVNDQGNGVASTYTLTATTFQRNTPATGLVTYATVETVNLNAGSATDLINVTSTAASVNTTINTNAGADTVTVASTGMSSTVVVNGNGGNNRITLQNTGAASVTLVNANGGDDMITVQASGVNSGIQLNGSAGADTLSIQTTASGSVTEVNGGTGNDTVTVGSSAPTTVNGILGTVSIQGDADADALMVDDSGDTTSNTGTLTSTQITGLGMTVGITYGTLETLNISLGSGSDTFNIQSTAAGTVSTVNAHGGNDSVLVISDAPGSTGNLDGIAGPLTVDAGTGANTLTVSDLGGATANSNVVVTSTQITGFAGPADTTPLTYAASGGTLALILQGSNTVADVFNVRSTSANATTTINGNGDNDTINVSSDAPTNNGTLDGLAGTLSVDAGPGANTLVVSDLGQTALANSATVLTSNQITGFAGPTNGTVLNYTATGGTLALTLRGSNTLADTITVQNTAANATTTLNTNGGDDTINVQAISALTTINAGAGTDTINVGSPAPARLVGIQAALLVNGETGTDTLNVDDTGETRATSGTLTSTQITGLGMTVGITYDLLEAVNIGLGQANDSFSIASTHAGTTRVSGNNGDDRFLVSATAGPTTLSGGAGSDQFVFADQATLSAGEVNGGDGIDLLNYQAYRTGVEVNLALAFARPVPSRPADTVRAIENVVGGSAADRLTGDDGPNQLEGRAGNDSINGLGGNDTILGEAGDDQILGGLGSDLIDGGDGNDRVAGDDSTDSPAGGSDTLLGGLGSDILNGESGNDLLIAGPLPAGTDPDTLLGGQGGDLLVIEDCNQATRLIDSVFAGPLDAGDQLTILSVFRTSNRAAEEQIGALSNVIDINALGAEVTPARLSVVAAPADVAAGFLNSEEYRSRVITEYYQKYLGRSPEAGGLRIWLNALASGARQEDVLTGILSSAEYYVRHGSTDAGFIQALYRDVLGRSAGQGEVDQWLRVLGTSSRAGVIQGFVTSDEFRSALLDSWYQRYLGRNVDSTGLAFWLGEFRRGLTQEEVQVGLVTSAEYQQRVHSQFLVDPESAIVRGLYRDLLGRTATQLEINGWLQVLGLVE